MSEPIVFGAAYSVYVRTVRLTLQEKQVSYRLQEVDAFAPGGPPVDYLARQPFGRIPAFEHDGFCLYETSAISHYVDEAFDGPRMQPNDATLRARMNQIIGLLDSYAYRTLVWDIYVERADAPREGRASDEAKIAAALPRARLCLAELTRLMGLAPFLAGDALTLADLHAAPMFAYFLAAPEGAAMLAERPALAGWWQRMAARPAMTSTRPSLNAIA
ncbi:MAG TPA: glutathione S-transferase family protein [Verrucomicrobiae bacterium]|nr:glutathione S-transferase family protein [Verrucomicrobiae bacterium]